MRKKLGIMLRSDTAFPAATHGNSDRSLLEVRQPPADVRKIVLLVEFNRCKSAFDADDMLREGHGELTSLGEKGGWIAGHSDQPLKTLGEFVGVVIENGPIESLLVDV